MSSLYIVLFCNFYVTIWCKDNKLIIYLLKLQALGDLDKMSDGFNVNNV